MEYVGFLISTVTVAGFLILGVGFSILGLGYILGLGGYGILGFGCLPIFFFPDFFCIRLSVCRGGKLRVGYRSGRFH